jgi:hypothetical protein
MSVGTNIIPPLLPVYIKIINASGMAVGAGLLISFGKLWISQQVISE